MARQKPQKRVPGDIVEIDLGDGSHTYARVLEEALFAFYDGRFNEELAQEEVVNLPTLFQVPVMNKAVKSGRWRIVGNVPLDSTLLDPAPRFIQDALKKDRLQIYHRGRIRPATKEECTGLEREAVWDPTHVEDRLRDHHAGRPNKWVKSLEIKA
jgi:Immunity protein 26